jgi:hypothetical protein
MKHNVFASILIGLVICLSISTSAATYGGGSGSSADPYQIWTPQQMNTIGANSGDWGQCFKLMADLDMSIYTGTQYNRIGNSATAFTGTFDGNGHVIGNLTYATGGAVNRVGLFGYANGATIQNLGLEYVSISTGGNQVGGIVGYSDNCSITSCHVTTGSVSGYLTVGALAGYTVNSTLVNCYATGLVNGFAYIGGLAGLVDNGSVNKCYSISTVTGSYNSQNIGGLVGDNAGSVTGCYAAGSVSGTYGVGGLVGTNENTVTNCYATGVVSGGDYLGGLVGWNPSGTITACFWDTEASGLSYSDGGTGKTTAQMKTVSTFTDAGWDFSATDGDIADWFMPYRDYPDLSWDLHHSGSGTSEDPWQIWRPQQMNTIGVFSSDWGSHFILMADIDMTYITYNIIGNSTTAFTGTFDGNGHVISNLTYATSQAVNRVGLFGYANGATVQNLGLEYVSISTGGSQAGGLIGYSDYCSITSCYVTGSVGGYLNVGGLVGYMNHGTITSCYSTGWVSGFAGIGGLAGLVGNSHRL